MVRGERAGSAVEDNARVIAEQAARVANFRATRSKQLLSAGPLPPAPHTGIEISRADLASAIRLAPGGNSCGWGRHRCR